MLDKISSQDILKDISEKGVWLLGRLNKFITNSEFEDYYATAGHPSWSFLLIRDGMNSTDYEMKTLFLQEMFKRGILTLGSHNLSSAHSYADLEKLMTIYEEVLPILVNADKKNIVKKLLDCNPLAPSLKCVNMKVGFRVDSGVVIGAGHLSRCLTLANKLILDGVSQCFFIFKSHEGNLAATIEHNGFGSKVLPLEFQPDYYSGDYEQWVGGGAR